MPHNFKVIRRANYELLQRTIMQWVDEMSQETATLKVENVIDEILGEVFQVIDGPHVYTVKFKRHEIINEVKILANEDKLKLGEYRKNITERTVASSSGYE